MINIFFESNITNKRNASLELAEYIPHNKSTIDKADLIISSKFPNGTKEFLDIQSALYQYKESKVRVLVFHITDFCEDLDIPAPVMYFRTSLYKSKQKHNEFILPYIWEAINNESNIYIKKSIKPIVGFCGHVVRTRKLTLDTFAYNKNFTTNYLIRSQFWGGKPNDETLIEEFKQNILNSHFTVCDRGNGNFSMRFYQVLSAGRIPVFIDSDMSLPFEDEIPWSTITVSAKTPLELIKKTKQFYDSNDIEVVQKKCRNIYEIYFRPEKYMIHIYNRYIKQIH
jgi:hypothetical protein